MTVLDKRMGRRMTAPDKIWAWGHTRSLTNGGWMGHAIGYADAEYTRTDLIQAMIDKAVGEERERVIESIRGWSWDDEDFLNGIIFAIRKEAKP